MSDSKLIILFTVAIAIPTLFYVRGSRSEMHSILIVLNIESYIDRLQISSFIEVNDRMIIMKELSRSDIK